MSFCDHIEAQQSKIRQRFFFEIRDSIIPGDFYFESGLYICKNVYKIAKKKMFTGIHRHSSVLLQHFFQINILGETLNNRLKNIK